MDKNDYHILDFFKHVGQMLEDGDKQNCGVILEIHPKDVHILYEAFKAKGIIIH